MTSKLLIVVGSGPGIGTATACHFASQGYSVALLSRDAERLKEDARRVFAAAGGAGAKFNTYAVDVADSKALTSTLDKVKDEMGLPHAVLFNAARVAPSEFGKIPLERLSEDFQIMNIGLYVTASWAVPLLEEAKKLNPDSSISFLMTGGGIWSYPAPPFFALSMQKAAQVNLANSLIQIVQGKGIHVATVSVNAPVSDDNKVVNAKNIAGKFWKLHEQQESQWESMVHVGEFGPLQL